MLAGHAAVPRAEALNVCERTVQVKDAIVEAAGGSDCAQVATRDLREITALDISNQGIATLRAGDFDGLVRLRSLDLSENLLASLPEGIFDELYLLKSLQLDGNVLSALRADLFEELLMLEELTFRDNPLVSPPEGLFAEFSILDGTSANGEPPDNSGAFPRIERFLNRHGITSPDTFIEALPDIYKRRFAMVYHSEAAARNHVSADHPRFVSWGDGGDFIFAWNTDPDAPSQFREGVEFLRQNDTDWTAGTIDFSGADTVISEPASCQSCHGSLNKPLWGAHLFWEGTEYVDPSETALHAATQAAIESTDPRIEPLDFSASYFQGPFYHVRYLEMGGYRNWTAVVEEAGGVFSWRHAEVLFRRLKSRGGFRQFAEETMCESESSSSYGDRARAHALEPFTMAEHNPAVLSEAGTAIQGGSLGVSWVAPDYSYAESARLGGAVVFLIAADLWEQEPIVRRLFRKVQNDDAILATARQSVDELLFYDAGTATAEDELVQKLRLHFGSGGWVAFNALGRQNSLGYDSSAFYDGLLDAMAPRVCNALTGAAPSNLEVELVDGNPVLRWDAPTYDSGSITAYRILRGVNGASPAVLIEDTGSTGTTWTDDSPPAGDLVYVVKTLYDDYYASPGSAETAATAFVPVDATLSALSLSGIDIGTFSSAVTSYAASVGHAVASTTVTATASDAAATVAIAPANPVPLAEGANQISVTVTAEDGTTTQAYTVTVTRARPPEVTIAALASPVTEGAATQFEVTLDVAASGPLNVALSVTESGSVLAGTAPASLAFSAGDTSLPLSVSTVADSDYEPDSTVTVTVGAGTGYTLGAAFSAAVTVQDDDAPRPNILVLLSDDMGWGQPGFNGGTEVATPNMDRIASEGVKLTQFYVQPLCTPTRAALLTGRYPWKNGTELRASLSARNGMLTDERTLAEALGDAGYATWIVGKWHLGQWQSAHLPLQRGFDHHYGHYSGEINSFTLHRGRNHRGILDWHRNERPVVESGYSTFLMAREAIQLIERHDDVNPFFLYLPFNAVHNPNDAPQEYIDLYSGSSEPKQRAQLKAMDVAIGQVLDALEQKGVLDDTLVMFLNDNGGTPTAGWNAPYRGKKSEFHEGGIRVPAVLRWPEAIPAGSESDALLHVADLFPTLAGLADADTGAGLPLDGLDVWAAVSGDADSPRTEVVYSLDVIRMGDWKLIDEGIDHYGFTTDAPELYNIADDPYETTNLAAANTATVAMLRARLEHHAQFARAGEPFSEIPNHPPDVYGEDENTAFGRQAYRAVTQLRNGNPGPTLARLEAVGNTVRLTYDEWLDSGSVPPPSAFAVVLEPSSAYTRTEVTDVAVGGSQVELTLAQAAPSGTTVGLTYEVPDTGAIRDEDELEAVGFVWATATAAAAFIPVDATLSALSLSGVDIGTFSSAITAYQASVPHSVTTTTVTAATTRSGATVAIAPANPVTLAEGANQILVTVTAEDGTTTQTYTLTVTRARPPEVTIAALASPVTEGAAAQFEVTLDAAAGEPLNVALSVTESGSVLSGSVPASLTFSAGDTSLPLSVSTVGDSDYEPDSTVTASVGAGTGYTLGAAFSAAVTVQDDDAPRPNILLFLSDDMGWAQPGFNGGTEVATPNMDRIANEGVKLTQFYAQPVCTPTRSALLTGRHAWKTGTARRIGIRESHGMPTDERTLAEALRGAGYATWIAGKWHLGQWQSKHLPLQRGFDHHYGLYSALIDSFTHRRYQVLDWHRNGRPVIQPGYSTFLLAEEATQLIERHDGSSPFFLYLPFNAVHDPFDAPQEYIDLYSHTSLPEQRAQLKAMDVAIGQVLDALEDKGVLDDTLVMFLNDNGGMRLTGGNPPYRGTKRYYYEGGIRVPAVLRWAGKIPAGSESDELLDVVDLFPTFAGLAGADPSAGLPLDGLDAWATISAGASSPRTEVVHSLKVIRAGDWKLFEQDGADFEGTESSPLQLYNISEDPYETTNLAAAETAKVAELRERLAHHAGYARAGETVTEIPNHPPAVYGMHEASAYGAEVLRVRRELNNGNQVPTLLRLEAVGNTVKLTYDEWLDAGSVPPPSAFSAVLAPSSAYTRTAVTDVAVGGTQVVLTLERAALIGTTVGLTYEVPDAGAFRDEDEIDAVGFVWKTATAATAFVPVDATLSALSLSGIDIGTFSGAVTSYAPSVGHAVTSTTVTATASDAAATVAIAPANPVPLAEGPNQITVTVTARDGATTATYTVTVTRMEPPEVTIAAAASPVAEGAPATFEVSLAAPAPESLTVAVNVTESGSMLAGLPPASVTFSPGDVRATLSVPTAGDTVVEADSAVTATVAAGTGYVVGSVSSASVTVEDDDDAVFAVSAAPATIQEGERATLTVAISNGVTFTTDQHVALAVSGSASAADYTLAPAALALLAGQSSATAEVTALEDQQEEADETLTLTASHGGTAIGATTLTIESVSHDATLSALSLSGIDIGTFSGATTTYQASVAHAVTTTSVTATPTHPEAAVTIAPGPAVSLAEGANEIAVTVTAEDGTTTQAYTVTVTRAGAPQVTIAAVASPVTEGTAATFEVRLAAAASEALTVALNIGETGTMLAGTAPQSVGFSAGETRVALSVPTAGDSVVEADSTVTATVTGGTGYTVGAQDSASVTVQDDDTATFAVSADAEAISEGHSATLTVAIANGVTFATNQTIDLAASGTASAADYTLVPAALTLAAGASSTTAEVTALEDQQEEADETLTLTASHGGAAVGAATLTIKSVSHDATLSALSLSGIDIGTFSGATTTYQASVAHALTTTTVTATATHPEGTVSIAPGPEVSLAEGANEIAVTVTAEDGTTTQTYTVTVTRLGLPVVSIVAVEERLLGPIGECTISRTGPTAEPLDVQVIFTTSHTSKAQSLTVRIPRGQSSVTRRLQVGDNKVVEDDITVTWTLQEHEAYTVSAERASASVVLEESDIPEFAVTADPAQIAEGESATITVAITNGVRFRQAQTIALSVSGTASAADYTLVPATLTLNAFGTSPTFSTTATLAALVDSEQEAPETVTVAALHDGVSIGTATVTVESVSHDATLSALSLSGIDIGTFSGATTTYQASVAHAVTTTMVTATATHPEATVSITPGPEVSLAEGANEIAVTVTAENGATTRTYTVSVTRASVPVVSIAAVAERVSEADSFARFKLSRTGPTAEPLAVQVLFATSTSQSVQTLTVRIYAGQSSVTGRVQVGDNTIVEDDVTVTWTLQEGAGYAVSESNPSASVVLEEDDVPEFAVSVDPSEIAEGESATVTVEITNGVTFRRAQAIALSVSGTASASDYRGVPATLSLDAYGSPPKFSTTATLTALADGEQEEDETVTVTASHKGVSIGSATVTIADVESTPLTARFLELPETHDGQTVLEFKLQFSEPVSLTNRALRTTTVLNVTGGAVTGARRVTPGVHLGWWVQIRPASDADVVVVLPVTTDCEAATAVCTASGKPLSTRLEAAVKGPGSQPSGDGSSLAPENSSPSGIWSDGETAWVADLADARLYAYQREDGDRQPDKDIATEPAPMGLWSDGQTLWVAQHGGGLLAYRLADGARLAARDLALEADAAPAGLWSDGETAWVSEWLGDTVHAYRLEDGRRVAGRDIKLAGGNLLPVGLWSGGQTLWVADWRERLYAYRLSDGERMPELDLDAGSKDEDPSGLWSAGGTLLSTNWESSEVQAHPMPVTAPRPAEASQPNGSGEAAGSVPLIAEPALLAYSSVDR